MTSPRNPDRPDPADDAPDVPPRLHDMGGDIGPADDSAISTDPAGASRANYPPEFAPRPADAQPVDYALEVDETNLDAASGAPDAVKKQHDAGGP